MDDRLDSNLPAIPATLNSELRISLLTTAQRKRSIAPVNFPQVNHPLDSSQTQNSPDSMPHPTSSALLFVANKSHIFNRFNGLTSLFIV